MTTSAMWQGKVDGGDRVKVFRFTFCGWTASLYRQFTGDAYGAIGDHSWVWSLTVIRHRG